MKKYFSLSTIFFLLLISFNVNAQKMESGHFFVGPEVSGYNLDKGNGDRIVTVEVKFKKPFENKPNIVFTVTQVEADKNTNLRYTVESSFISQDGFLIKVKTWSDCKIYGLGGFWIAHE